MLVVFESGALLYDFLEEHVVAILSQHLLRELLILGKQTIAPLIFLLLQILAYYLSMLLP